MILAPHARVEAQETLLVQSGETAAPWVAELESAVLAELRARGRDVVLPAPARSPAMPALAPALAAYHDLRPAEALDLLDDWLEAAGSAGDLAPEERAQGHVWRARVLMALEQPGVEEALDAALRVMPELTLDQAVHPPPLIDALAARRDALVMAPLELTARPEGATVYIDGRRLTPGTHALPLGTHLLHVTAPRCLPITRTWEHVAGAAPLSLELSPRAGAVGERVPPQTLARLAERGRRPLLLEVTGQAHSARLRLHDGARTRTSGPGSEAARLAAELFVTRVAPPSTETLPLPSPTPATTPALDVGWLVAGVGAGVLVLGALVVGLVVGLSPANGFDAVGMRVP